MLVEVKVQFHLEITLATQNNPILNIERKKTTDHSKKIEEGKDQVQQIEIIIDIDIIIDI